MKTGDATRIVQLWLKEEAHEDASHILDLALAEAADVQQRRATWLARRFSIMNGNTVRYGIAAAVLVIAAMLGAALLRDVGAPNTTSSPTPDLSPIELPRSETSQNIAGGLYSASVGEGARNFEIDLTIPAGWVAQRATVGEISLTGPDGTYPYLGFFSVRKVYADPCHPSDGFAGGHLAPVNSPELVNELAALPGFETGSVIEVQLGGEYRAMHFFLSNSIDTEAAACANRALLPLFETWNGESVATNPGTTIEVWVVQDGLYPMLIVAEVRPHDPGADRAAIDEMIATLEVH